MELLELKNRIIQSFSGSTNDLESVLYLVENDKSNMN